MAYCLRRKLEPRIESLLTFHQVSWATRAAAYVRGEIHSMVQAKFRVDTHLFRELGQLLVGRDSTALIELVKNAYDADATEVIVYGEALDDPERGSIVIQDNGVGMDAKTFERGFLTVASRLKEEGERRSLLYNRRYTGAKGIGRLAAHKLARRLEIESVPRSKSSGVAAWINWDRIEEFETLDEIDNKAISVQSKVPISAHGTKITLRKLRQPWTLKQLGDFLAEVEGLKAPSMLTEPLSKNLLAGQGLFSRPKAKDSVQEDPGIDVKLEGGFASGDNYWPAIAQSAHWLIDIDASPRGVQYAIVPTQHKLREAPNAEPQLIFERHRAPKDGPFFQARILIREGGKGNKEFKAFASRVSGIRVYQEGFRVLPYGEPSNDWLHLNRDTIDRSRVLKFVDDSDLEGLSMATEQEGLSLLPSKHYFGAVFLTIEDVPDLVMLVNREGFVPNANFERLQQIVRRGIDLATRIRASVNLATRAATSSDTSASPRPDPKPTPKLDHIVEQLPQQTAAARAVANTLDGPQADAVRTLIQSTERVTEVSQRIIKEMSLIRVLASVGTQLAAFVHEMNRLLAMAQGTETFAKKLREDTSINDKARARLSKLVGFLGDLRRAIEQQASYFGDILAPDARRRRSRLRLAEQLATSIKLVEQTAAERKIQIQNEIPLDLKSPPMFPAQLMAVFSNLLTNAIKAAGQKGRILATAEAGPHDAVILRIENTGTAVDLKNADRWFRPFESTTTEVDPVLGQGMGLGLGITRDILSEIGATIEFTRPRKGYATAVQINFPG